MNPKLWKPGDKLVVVSGQPPKLPLGEIVIFKEIWSDGLVVLEGKGGSRYFPKRFKLLEKNRSPKTGFGKFIRNTS